MYLQNGALCQGAGGFGGASYGPGAKSGNATANTGGGGIGGNGYQNNCSTPNGGNGTAGGSGYAMIFAYY
jgi:hypothetical protein